MTSKYRIACAALAWVIIIGQYIVLLREGNFGGFGASTLTYLGFFTVLTNIGVALAFSVPLMKAGSGPQRFFTRPAVRAALALYILVVAVIYYAVLAKDHHPEGLSALFNIGLHFVLPVLYLLDWLIFADKQSMSYRAIPYWVVFPLAYGVFNILRGLATGFYPYPFLNVTELGYGGVALSMAGFTVFYALGAAAFIALGRVLTR